jgi:hypothetical protein
MSDDPFDHNGECRYCDELGMHRADCSWLLQLMQEHAVFAAGAEELAARIDALETENKGLREALLALQLEVELLHHERDYEEPRE